MRMCSEENVYSVAELPTWLARDFERATSQSAAHRATNRSATKPALYATSAPVGDNGESDSVPGSAAPSPRSKAHVATTRTAVVSAAATQGFFSRLAKDASGCPLCPML